MKAYGNKVLIKLDPVSVAVGQATNRKGIIVSLGFIDLGIGDTLQEGDKVIVSDGVKGKIVMYEGSEHLMVTRLNIDFIL